MFQRVIIIVLDGVGIGALPDAVDYGDQEAATLQHVAETAGGLNLPCLEHLGLGCIAPIAGLKSVPFPLACWGKMREKSPGKDSVTGHWEIAGVVLDQPFATFPEGFPEAIIDAFKRETGFDPLGNVAASGTDILRELGEEHLKTGRPIVYTSSDSVFQIAAHEMVLPPEDLYKLCRQVELLLKPYNICRVIARPFKGTSKDDFYRTGGRHDFSVRPPESTLLERLKGENIDTYGVGKIHDLFAGTGLKESCPTKNNSEGMAATIKTFEKINQGLVMTNLVDFDMLYGHRLDPDGFAAALEEFDRWLPDLLESMRVDDLLIMTADHGCDPTLPGTDHTREFVPLLAYTESRRVAVGLGIRQTFADVGATVAENFGLSSANGQSFLAELTA